MANKKQSNLKARITAYEWTMKVVHAIVVDGLGVKTAHGDTLRPNNDMPIRQKAYPPNRMGTEMNHAASRESQMQAINYVGGHSDSRQLRHKAEGEKRVLLVPQCRAEG